MSKETVPITITCPDWCQETPEHHAAELFHNGGECSHLMPERMVTDQTGIERPLAETYERPPQISCGGRSTWQAW